MRKYRNISDADLAIAVASSSSIMAVLRFLGIKEAGGSHSHYSKRIERIGIDISHFRLGGENKEAMIKRRKSPKEILVKRVSGKRGKAQQLVRSLIDIGRVHCCEKCGQLPNWQGNVLTLDVDHINQDWLDDRPENLRFLCPNCHSQFSRKLIKVSPR